MRSALPEIIVDLLVNIVHLGTMKNRALLLLFPLMISAALTFWGCADRDENKTAENITFDVNPALLGDSYHEMETGLVIRIPVGFEYPVDTVFSMLKSSYEEIIGAGDAAELVQAYLDTVHTAGIMIARVDTLLFSSDSVGFIDFYRDSVYRMFGTPRIRESEFDVNNVHIYSFLVTDGVLIRSQMLCLTGSDYAVELTFFAPEVNYADLFDYWSSTVGSLRVERK